MGSTLLGAIHVQVFSRYERKTDAPFGFSQSTALLSTCIGKGNITLTFLQKGNVLYYQIIQTKLKVKFCVITHQILNISERILTMAHTTTITALDIAKEEYKQAQEAYKDAMQKFNLADEDVFEIANEELSLAQMKLNVSAKKVKMLMAENK